MYGIYDLACHDGYVVVDFLSHPTGDLIENCFRTAPPSLEFDFMLEQFRQLGYPEIEAVPNGESRLQWSVMIPTYNCANLLRETLASVLKQDPGPERMQIEVIDDASNRDDPEAVVRELGQGRVTFFRHAKNVGATANFNACLSRSRGHLIHILHGDDLVLPGFYTQMEKLLEQYPSAGLASCRYAFMDADGIWIRLGRLNQRFPGIFSDALAKIAIQNWTQFAAVVLRRSLVEAIGGFHPSLIHATDWDLWKCAALYQPVAYDPTVMACYRIFEGNDTSRLIKTGANSVDMRRAIELSSHYLPPLEASAWIRKARHWAAVGTRRWQFECYFKVIMSRFENNSARHLFLNLLFGGPRNI